MYNADAKCSMSGLHCQLDAHQRHILDCLGTQWMQRPCCNSECIRLRICFHPYQTSDIYVVAIHVLGTCSKCRSARDCPGCWVYALASTKLESLRDNPTHSFHIRFVNSIGIGREPHHFL